MAGHEERGGRGAGGSGEAQAQGQPRDSAMAPMQPSLGPPRDEPRVFGLDKFNGDNFAEWSFKMENIFDHYDLLEVMEGTEKRPENDPEKSPWVRKSAQGYLLLGQALGSSQIRHIKPFQREPEKGPKAWAALKGVHAPATAAVAVVLERQMAALRIEEDDAVEEGVQKFFDLFTRLEGADLNYSELQKKTKLLALLPDSWSSLIINLNRDLPRLSLEDVKRAILQEDFRRRELASADGAGAASIGRGYGRGRGRGRGGGRFGGSNFNGGRGSGGYGSDNQSYGRGRGRFDGECHYCHKSGHMWRDCFKLPDGWTPAQGQEGRGAGGGRGRGRGGRRGRGGGAASMKSAGNESESRDDRFRGQFFFVSTQESAGPEKDEGFEEPAAVGKVTLHSLDYWVIDSGATYSMTPPEEEGRGKRRIQAPNRLTYDALGKPAKSALAGAALMVGEDEESDYEEFAFAFFSPVEMPGEPATLKEALESSDAEEWKKAMESELKSIEENGTWELVELPEGRKAITSKWLFKIKSDADGKIERYKSRLVAKGYQQKEKVDYKELFAPVVKPTTLRTLLAGAAVKGWVVKQMDVTTAFLNGVLEEEIIMAQPEGFDDGSGRVLRLKKALYGLKQAPRQWYLKLRGVLEEIGFTPSTADHSLFMLGEGEQRSFMVVYVDDILIFSPSSDLVKEVMLKLQDKFKCKALGDGYQQKEKVDYKELFAPVVKPTTLRTLLAGAAIKGWVVKQTDVTTAFLNGVLEEEIFMAQPEGFDDGSGRVLRLKKALYGLKQVPRQWYLKLRGVLEEIGFTPSTADHSLFMLGEGEQRSFMVVYVDDILIFSPSSDLVKDVMLKVQDKFKCKALGDVSFYLGLHIERDVEKRCMRVHQRKYLEALTANFGQSEGHVATPFPSGFKCVKGPEEESVGEEERCRFHSLVGSLMYAAVNTRPDVAFATGQLARVVQCPNEEQVAAGMRVAKYLGQTPTVGLQYSAAGQRRQKGADGVEPGRLFLTAFSDASYASEPEDMTSVGGFICSVGGGPTAWESKKQVDQALSSVDSEYMALFRAVREILWQRRLLAELGEEQQGPTPLYCDSQGAIALAKNPVLHGLTKHMRVKWHWTRSMVAAGEVELHYVKTTGQPADMMTKRLVEQQQWKCCKLAGMALN
ncbi:unnamed protein product [Closterium sp. NIES-53]